MPTFKGIVTDSELVAIPSYIKSSWTEGIRKDHDQVNMMYEPDNRAVRDLIDTDIESQMTTPSPIEAEALCRMPVLFLQDHGHVIKSAGGSICVM